jgi:hypothetical protein
MTGYIPLPEERCKELVEKYYPIFNHFANNHNLLLTDTEIDDIINVVRKVIGANND